MLNIYAPKTSATVADVFGAYIFYIVVYNSLIVVHVNTCGCTSHVGLIVYVFLG
jgi:hypothetical protein